jgi:uncharacterized damage-inducible protein DinB
MSQNPARQLTLTLPVGFPPELALGLAALEDARRRTRATVTSLNESTINWEPPASRNSIGTLLYHIAATEMEWLSVELLGGRELSSAVAQLLPHGVRDEQGALVRVRGETAEDHLARLDATRRHLVAALEAMSDAEWRRPRPTAQGTVTPAWVLHHLAQHEAEHRGQIQLLRAMAARPAASRQAAV